MKTNKAKVDIWENGCGANVGKNVIIFTGRYYREGGFCTNCNDGILVKDRAIYKCNKCFAKFSGKVIKAVGGYVTLKYPIWQCNELFCIENKKPSTLRAIIKKAKGLRKEEIFRVGRMGKETT